MISLRIAGLLQLLQLRSRLFIRNFQILVGIVAAERCHGENLAGFGIHHQPESTVLHIVAGDGRFHLLFQTGLHRRIQRQDQAVPLIACNVLFIRKGHIHLVVALGGNNLSGFPFQKAVIRRFYALGALV